MSFTQTNRPLRIETTLGPNVLLLESLKGVERVSAPFQFTLELLSENASIAGDSLLRTAAKVTIELYDGGERHINGIISRFVTLGVGPDKLTRYRAEIVPWLSLTQLSSDCRVFQNVSATDIAEKLFKELGFADYQIKVMTQPPKRDYCVQYRETHFNFISRLLEEEGIFYFFEHDASRHTLILADHKSAFAPCPNTPKLGMSTTASGMTTEPAVIEFSQEHRVCSGSVALADYNYEQPNRKLLTTVSGTQKGELYDYPGIFQVQSDGDRIVRVRMAESEAMQLVVSGASNSPSLTAGYRFDYKQTNKTYTLLQVSHEAEVPYGQSDESTWIYRNEFQGIPNDTEFRPARVAERPVVHGSQTAVVTGKSGEEIWVDNLGRVKVQFFWDRVGKKDESTSCWVRVASTWAGKNWGFVAIPRIGQEVIVDFLEGDPDRPIITGRVYNGEQGVPYALPANQTQSGTKSRSSKGGGTDNFNELRFEDKKGSEQIFAHAEKDLLTEVENDETRTVGHDRTTTIDNNETRTVTKGNEAVTIKKGNKSLEILQGDHTVVIEQGKQTVTLNIGDQSITLKKGDHTISLDMGDHTTIVKMGNHTTKVNVGSMSTKVMQEITEESTLGIELKVAGNSIKIDNMGVHIKGLMVDIEGQVQTQVKGLMTQIQGTAMLQTQGGITMMS